MTAHSTRKRMSRPVLTYRLTKGRLSSAVTKLSKFQLEGRIWGGMAIASAWVLKAVRIIHTKGKIMMMLPRIRTTYVSAVESCLLLFMLVFILYTS